MKLLFTILGVISGLIGLALSILPFGLIALIPTILAFVFGLLAFKMVKNENSGKGIIKLIFLLVILALGITIYRSIFDENKVENDIETIQKGEERDKESLEELEDIKIDD